MIIKQLQALDMIASKYRISGKFVIQYHGDILSVTTSQSVNTMARKGPAVFADYAARKFDYLDGKDYIEMLNINESNLPKLISFVESVDDDVQGDVAAFFDITSLKYGYHLPFMTVDETEEFEVISFITNE